MNYSMAYVLETIQQVTLDTESGGNYSIDVNARTVWHCFLAVPHEVATDGTSTRSPLAESLIDRYRRWKKTVPGHRETEHAMSTGGGRVIENFRLVVPTKKAARKFANHFGGNKV